jgi:hypothetical protein
MAARELDVMLPDFDAGRWLEGRSPDEVPEALWEYLRRYKFVLPYSFADRLRGWRVPSYLVVVHPNPASKIPGCEIARQLSSVPARPSDFEHIVRTLSRYPGVLARDFWARYVACADAKTDFSPVLPILTRRFGNVTDFVCDVFAASNGCPGACQLARQCELLGDHPTFQRLVRSCRPLHSTFWELTAPYLLGHIAARDDPIVIQGLCDQIRKGEKFLSLPQYEAPPLTDDDLQTLSHFFEYSDPDDPFGYRCQLEIPARRLVAEAGLSVAYHAKPATRAGASIALDFCGLDGLLSFLE